MLDIAIKLIAIAILTPAWLPVVQVVYRALNPFGTLEPAPGVRRGPGALPAPEPDAEPDLESIAVEDRRRHAFRPVRPLPAPAPAPAPADPWTRRPGAFGFDRPRATGAPAGGFRDAPARAPLERLAEEPWQRPRRAWRRSA